MELKESIEFINKKLIDEYGVDTIKNIPIFRVMGSEDQFEKRLGTYEDYTTNGIFIREVTEVREVPKYRQWIREKYVLERLVVVPDYQENILPTEKVTYEPLFVFEDALGNYLPPQWMVAKVAVDCVYAAQGKKSLASWKGEFSNQEEEIEDRNKRIQGLQDAIFGDETVVTDALARKTGIVVGSSKIN